MTFALLTYPNHHYKWNFRRAFNQMWLVTVVWGIRYVFTGVWHSVRHWGCIPHPLDMFSQAPVILDPPLPPEQPPYGQPAVGTHPTGMYSCWKINFTYCFAGTFVEVFRFVVLRVLRHWWDEEYCTTHHHEGNRYHEAVLPGPDASIWKYNQEPSLIFQYLMKQEIAEVDLL